MPAPRNAPFVIGAACLGGALALGCASPTPIPPRSPGSGLAAAGDQAGVLPAASQTLVASVTPAVSPTPGPTVVVPPPEPLELPPGFEVSVFAELGLPVAMMAVATGGELFATVPGEDRIIVLPDADRNGRVDPLPTGTQGTALTFAQGDGLNRPWGLAFGPDALYVACADGLWSFAYRPGQLMAQGRPRRLMELPGADVNWERGLARAADGRLLVSVGAPCQSCEPADARAASVLSFDPTDGQVTRMAAGLRRSLDLAIHPTSAEVFVPDQGREGLGDELPPDEINRLAQGAHFGWPSCFGASEPDLQADAPPAEGFCAATTAPLVQLQAHSAVSGLLFYTGSQFPPDYRGDLYVVSHGSDARRELPLGYNVLRIPMKDGLPRGEVFDFVSGWLRPDTRRWGSPVDLAQAPDGSLLISDDRGGRIYRVFSTLPTPTPALP